VWWGTVNREISQENFDKLYKKMVAAMNEKSCSSRTCSRVRRRGISYRFRVINEYAWHNLFCHNLFIRPPKRSSRSIARSSPSSTCLP